MFIHDALCELIICGDSEIAAPNLRIAINRLHKQAEGKVVSGFEHQFQVSLILQTLCQCCLGYKRTLSGSVVSSAGVSKCEGVL